MAAEHSGMERRMVHRFLAHWRASQEEDSLPTLESVLSRDLGDIEPLMFILKPSGDGQPMVLDRVGEDLDDDNQSLVGTSVPGLTKNTLLAQAVDYHLRVLEKVVPITFGGEFTDPDGNHTLYRSVVMPVTGSNAEEICLLGAVNFKFKDDS